MREEGGTWRGVEGARGMIVVVVVVRVVGGLVVGVGEARSRVGDWGRDG